MPQPRSIELDALRGIAILLMVLSGAIAHGGVLPAWMYHAQVPPPLHQFNPAFPGITWVDLVFPFFLFSMGAAIPLSLAKRLDAGATPIQLFSQVAKRFLLLVWLAFYFNHVKPWVLSETYTYSFKWLEALGSFVVLFFIFYEFKNLPFRWMKSVIQILAVTVSIVQVFLLSYADTKPFHLGRVDIIILVLANMALFGSMVWWLTRYKPWLRLGILLFVMGIFLSKDMDGSWQQWLFQLTPNDKVYKFYFLKYLFIIVPGTFAGEWIMNTKDNQSLEIKHRVVHATMLAVLPLALVIINLYGLFTRQLTLNLFISLMLCVRLVGHGIKMQVDDARKKMINSGVFLLLLGLAFEAYEGGIKKDPSTYSYYFVTSGLAFLLLVSFYYLKDFIFSSKILVYFSLNGKNPLVAYVAGALVVTPLMGLTQLLTYWELMNSNAWVGLLRGILFTAIVSIITVVFTKKKWFWKS